MANTHNTPAVASQLHNVTVYDGTQLSCSLARVERESDLNVLRSVLKGHQPLTQGDSLISALATVSS